MPGSLPHRIGEIVMAAVGARDSPCAVWGSTPRMPTSPGATRAPNAIPVVTVGWPMLVVLNLRTGRDQDP